MFAKEREYPVSGAETAASHAKESQVLPKLAKLPVDCLKVSNEENVRIKTLRKYGFQNVISIYNLSAVQLKRIPGISLSTANFLGARLGSTFVDGGVHPRFGTRNFTAPLQNGQYIEVVCP
jgi:hypothetical protein